MAHKTKFVKNLRHPEYRIIFNLYTDVLGSNYGTIEIDLIPVLKGGVKFWLPDSLLSKHQIGVLTFTCHFAPNILGFNTLRPRQNGRHFADDILKCIFLNENV